ncbi:MAG: hypothetical protein ACPG06_01310 [Alphaproteobacteria bacterium]
MIAILGAALLLVAALYGASRALSLERPLAWYWLTGFGTWALAALAAIIGFLGDEGPTPLYLAITQLATLMGGTGFLIAAATMLIRPLPELWVNIAFLGALALLVTGQMLGLAGPAGALTMIVQIGLIGLGVSQYNSKGRPALMIGGGAAVMMLAPLLARGLPAGDMRFALMFILAAGGLYLLSEAAAHKEPT